VAVTLVVLAAVKQLGPLVVVVVDCDCGIGCQYEQIKLVTSPKELLSHIRSYCSVYVLFV
jgi:hypothetical protein